MVTLAFHLTSDSSLSDWEVWLVTDLQKAPTCMCVLFTSTVTSWSLCSSCQQKHGRYYLDVFGRSTLSHRDLFLCHIKKTLNKNTPLYYFFWKFFLIWHKNKSLCSQHDNQRTQFLTIITRMFFIKRSY
jgi:hypothetical protein